MHSRWWNKWHYYIYKIYYSKKWLTIRLTCRSTKGLMPCPPSYPKGTTSLFSIMCRNIFPCGPPCFPATFSPKKEGLKMLSRGRRVEAAFFRWIDSISKSTSSTNNYFKTLNYPSFQPRSAANKWAAGKRNISLLDSYTPSSSGKVASKRVNRNQDNVGRSI